MWRISCGAVIEECCGGRRVIVLYEQACMSGLWVSGYGPWISWDGEDVVTESLKMAMNKGEGGE